MSNIKFSIEQKEILTRKIQLYFNKEMDQEIGQFDAQFLLDFFGEEIGGYFYNQGLYDAQAVLQSRIETISEAIYEIEKPTELVR